MEVILTFKSKELNKEDVRLLIQSIRDCEVRYFPDKLIAILIEVPELTQAESREILESIKPPYKFGPITVKHGS